MPSRTVSNLIPPTVHVSPQVLNTYEPLAFAIVPVESGANPVVHVDCVLHLVARCWEHCREKKAKASKDLVYALVFHAAKATTAEACQLRLGALEKKVPEAWEYMSTKRLEDWTLAYSEHATDTASLQAMSSRR